MRTLTVIITLLLSACCSDGLHIPEDPTSYDRLCIVPCDVAREVGAIAPEIKTKCADVCHWNLCLGEDENRWICS